MKTLILSIVLILSASQLFAQVRTGGGGGPDIDTEDGRLKAYEAKMRLKHIFAELSIELIRIEKQCGIRTSVPAGYNFIDSFYTLSLKKSGDISDCEPSKKVSHCMNTKKLKSIMVEINDTPGATLYQYLKDEHKLDEKSATTILKFFKRP